jgi:hypothetical protein
MFHNYLKDTNENIYNNFQKIIIKIDNVKLNVTLIDIIVENIIYLYKKNNDINEILKYLEKISKIIFENINISMLTLVKSINDDINENDKLNFIIDLKKLINNGNTLRESINILEKQNNKNHLLYIYKEAYKTDLTILMIINEILKSKDINNIDDINNILTKYYK